MAAERTAQVEWHGGLARGDGRFTTGSGALGEHDVTWASRTERSEGRTSPEELIAAAHASCFAMALAHALDEGGHEPERLTVNATCTFDEVGDGFGITTMKLELRGTVPGLDESGFADAVGEAEQGCPVSNALRGNVDVSVDAKLEGG